MACEEGLEDHRKKLRDRIQAWEERVKPNSPLGWDSRRESGGIEDIVIRAHSCNLGLRGFIPSYAFMCPPMDYGPDVVWKRDLSLKVSIYGALPGVITEARWRLTLPLDLMLHLPNGFDNWVNEDVRLHGVLSIVSERWDRHKGLKYEWREGEDDRVGSDGKKLFPPWRWEARLTLGKRPDAEIWMVGVYCGVFLSEKQKILQRREVIRQNRRRRRKAAATEAASELDSDSSRSSDDYLP